MQKGLIVDRTCLVLVSGKLVLQRTDQHKMEEIKRLLFKVAVDFFNETVDKVVDVFVAFVDRRRRTSAQKSHPGKSGIGLSRVSGLGPSRPRAIFGLFCDLLVLL